MASPRSTRRAQAALDPTRVRQAFDRLARQRAFHTLVRGAVPTATLKRLLKDALPKSAARQMPPEVWSSLAVGIALDSPVFGTPLAEALQDRLAWDREPVEMDDWWQAVRERPLEALWMAALSESKPVRKEFAHMAAHCVENWRDSPECAPPSWEFVEGFLDVQAATVADLRQAEKRAEDAERKSEAERGKLDELREELKRLRRELASLRSERAEAERRAEARETRVPAPGDEAAQKIEDLERRLRKAEKEREHLHREVERLEARPQPPGSADSAAAGDASPPTDGAAESATAEVDDASDSPLSLDANPRRRVLRQMLRKLVKKGKIGGAHTHEDNVYRGVADHDKGIAKDAIDLLYREGFFVPKPTMTDPHVSIAPERLAEVRTIVKGEIANPRLRKFIEP